MNYPLNELITVTTTERSAHSEMILIFIQDLWMNEYLSFMFYAVQKSTQEKNTL